MAYTLGKDCKIKIGTNELKIIGDLTLNLTTGEADVTTRKNAGWKAIVTTNKEATIDFEAKYDATDAALTALQTAFFAGSAVAVTVEGTGVFTASCAVTQFNISQPLEDVSKVSITLKPTGEDAPTFTTGA